MVMFNLYAFIKKVCLGPLAVVFPVYLSLSARWTKKVNPGPRRPIL